MQNTITRAQLASLKSVRPVAPITNVLAERTARAIQISRMSTRIALQKSL